MRRGTRTRALTRARILHALDFVGLKAPLKWLVHEVLGLDRLSGALQARPRGPVISVAPHNLKLYEYFLRYHLAQGRRFITSDQLYGGAASARGEARILVRHDVDYTPERLERLAEIEDALGVCSDIHVVMDPAHYDAGAYADLLRSLARKGFCIGLHTLAPHHDDFYSVLRREIEVFRTLLGFAPRTFSIHGICPTPEDWSEKRERFLAKVAPRLASFGFVGSHNLSGVDFWIEDSGLGGEFAYLYADWVEAAPAAGQVMGVLVHPDHWTDWPIRWRIDENAVVEAPVLERFVGIARRYSAPLGAQEAARVK